MKKKVLVITGPTAVGKTDLALRLAKKYDGELVSCDSRQVYKGLDIGTGKEAVEELRVEKHVGFWLIDGVKIHMYDVVDLPAQYTLHDYVAQSRKVIGEILKEDKLPIIVGGTGLYLKGLLSNLTDLSVPIDPNIRKDLEGKTLEQLQEKLKSINIKKWELLNHSDRNNPRRLIRYIEVSLNPNSVKTNKSESDAYNWDILKIGLYTPRPLLNKRIDDRVDSRIQKGLIKEGEDLIKNGISIKRLKDLGLEYGVLAELFEGGLSREEFAEKLKIKIHQYAKRQMTWFKKDEEINWFDISEKSWAGEVENRIRSWYDAKV